MPVTPFRERIELAFPARMLWGAVAGPVYYVEPGREAEAEAIKARLIGACKRACMEPLEGLPVTVAAVLAKQLDRLYAQALPDVMQADKRADIAYHFLALLTESGYLDLWEGSAMADAATLVLPMIEHVDGARDASAAKQARRVLRGLQARGYYAEISQDVS